MSAAVQTASVVTTSAHEPAIRLSTGTGSTQRLGNPASAALLEKCGYKYEGVAQSYLQINGRWRTHVLYAALRADRRGRTGTG